jgi:hypothetical protein
MRWTHHGTYMAMACYLLFCESSCLFTFSQQRTTTAVVVVRITSGSSFFPSKHGCLSYLVTVMSLGQKKKKKLERTIERYTKT